MEMIHERTLKSQLVYFLLRIFGFIVLLPLLSIMFTYLLAHSHMIINANNAEIVIRKNMKKLQNPKIDYRAYLPVGARHVLFAADQSVIAGDMSEEDLYVADKLKKSINFQSLTNFKGFIMIQRGKQWLIISYRMVARINNAALGYPSVELLLLVFNLICISIFIIFETRIFVNKWKLFFINVEKIITNVNNKDLDFMLPRMDVKEFDDVFVAVTKLKNSLADSLKRQWHAETTKTRQLAALTHDLKIPLAIIRGNAELLCEDLTDEALLDMVRSICEAEADIENYLTQIMLLVQTKTTKNLVQQNVDTDYFINSIKKVITPFTKTHPVEVTVQINGYGILYIDEEALHRAILNVLMNALEYANKEVRVEIETTKDALRIIIIDDGPGFDPKTLAHATEFLYRGSESREYDGHFGIGLAFAHEIILLHNGRLTIQNGETLGASVELVIPFMHV